MSCSKSSLLNVCVMPQRSDVLFDIKIFLEIKHNRLEADLCQDIPDWHVNRGPDAQLRYSSLILLCRYTKCRLTVEPDMR